MSDNNRMYVFICGCARSGTSTMTDLLRSHPRFAMGRERYNSLFKRTGSLTVDLFQKERFCSTLLPGDTHHSTLDNYYSNLVNRFEACTHIGDKIPRLYTAYNGLAREFPGCKVIFMVRHIFGVAQSFEKRREHSIKNPGAAWPETKGYEQAVTDWNLSLSDTLGVAAEPDIMLVDYEKLYREDQVLSDIFDFLQSDRTDSVASFWNDACAARSELDAARPDGLQPHQKDHLVRSADFDSYQKLIAMAAQVR